MKVSENVFQKCRAFLRFSDEINRLYAIGAAVITVAIGIRLGRWQLWAGLQESALVVTRIRSPLIL